MTTEGLVTADKPGVPDTWDGLFQEHGAGVYRHALRMTRNHYEAEDLAQDVFVRAMQHLRDREPAGVERPGPLLHRITTNLFLDRLRHMKRIRFVPLIDSNIQTMGSVESDPADVLATRTLSREVTSALLALPGASREVMLLWAVEDLAYDHIAALTGTTRGTVASRIHRGRSRMRAELTGTPCPAEMGLGPAAAETYGIEDECRSC